MFWRSREETNQLKKDTDKAVRNIALFLIFGSLACNLIVWLAVSMVKFGGKSFQELINLKPLPSMAIGMGIAVLYTMWVVSSYRKQMALFKGDPNEEVCKEEKKKATAKIGICGVLSWQGWFISALINYLQS